MFSVQSKNKTYEQDAHAKREMPRMINILKENLNGISDLPIESEVHSPHFREQLRI